MQHCKRLKKMYLVKDLAASLCWNDKIRHPSDSGGLCICRFSPWLAPFPRARDMLLCKS